MARAPAPIDFRKRAVIPMWGKQSMQIEFELIVYGVEARELLAIPNATISALAARYPDHQSTMWDIRSKP